MNNQNDMSQQIKNNSKIKDMIINARRDNPGCIVVYFVRHKAANNLKKPNNPMQINIYKRVLFKKDARIEEVMYSLYEQIEIKGLSFYVLKSQTNDRFKYILLKPGVTIGQIFEEYSKNQYIPIIYHNQNIYSPKHDMLKRTIIKYAVMLAFVFLTFYFQPIISEYLSPSPSSQQGRQKIEYPDDFQQT